ncbi:glycosyltransferase family 4 protein [Gordonia polyisoprenivorans]|uniref:glycosyltransferase family 4 protein n=1 Tax=Gordonia polyisoprenivorans TaxID=84595 RepID=UPI001AD7BEE6|nr:glycosyltransferase family 4 protein [Gordonia polyisoprenivorans]QTI70572.1 glycosyltransferase family 4 protein [Gordonia polyisoprenivorans]
MTRALFVLHTAESSGAELAALRLAVAMHEMSAAPASSAAGTVEVAAAFAADGDVADRMRAKGIRTHLLATEHNSGAMTIAGRSIRRLVVGALGLARVGWELGALAREERASVLVAETTKALIMSAIASRRAGIPVVWHVHDRVTAEYFGAPLAVVVRLFGWLVSSAYIANSEGTANTLARWRRPTAVAYPGVTLRDDLERSPQRPADDVVVAMVGRLTRWKGQDLLLRAIRDQPIEPRRVLLVGGTFFEEPEYRHELEQYVASTGIPVEFTGHVDDPEKYMSEADILVHCSVMVEPFGQVVVEGMNAGCAVIASRPGGTTEIVEDGVNGLLVDSGDRSQLADALARLIADVGLRTTLSTNGRRRAERFDVRRSAVEVTEFLAWIATPKVAR